jgi:hypothetical protein
MVDRLNRISINCEALANQGLIFMEILATLTNSPKRKAEEEEEEKEKEKDWL